MDARSSRIDWLIFAALGFFWGSSYLFIKIGVDHDPQPFTLIMFRTLHRSIFLPTVAGEGLLIHNHTWHRSGLNHSGHPRRALSFCYMTADTRCLRKKGTPRSFVRLFEGP